MRISLKVIADLLNIQIKIRLKSNRIYTNPGISACPINRQQYRISNIFRRLTTNDLSYSERIPLEQTQPNDEEVFNFIIDRLYFL